MPRKPVTSTFDVPESLSLRETCAKVTVRKLGWKRLQRCTDAVYLEAFERFGDRASGLMEARPARSDDERKRIEAAAIEKHGAERVANRKLLAEYSEEQLIRRGDLRMDGKPVSEPELDELLDDVLDEDDVMWLALRVLEASGKLPETDGQRKNV